MNVKKFCIHLIFTLAFSNPGISHGAQIIGSDTVCAAYIYTYTVSMPGAVSFMWYLPKGWYFLNGQGTDSVTVNCNQTADTIRVAGYDSTGNVTDSVYVRIYWGGGGPRWIVNGTETQFCPSPVFVLYIDNNGPPCGNEGCGNGYPNPNVIYAAFSAPWPGGFYLGQVNGSNSFSDWTGFGSTIYVYEVDTTFGINNMILVQGGLGCPPLNTFYLPGAQPDYLYLQQNPDPVCYGDTFTVYASNGYYGYSYFYSYYWDSPYLMISASSDSAVFVLNDSSAYNMINFWGEDWQGCTWSGYLWVNAVGCHQPVANFAASNTKLCAGGNNCVNFTDHSTNNPTQWSWSFQGATPSNSSLQNPYNICYNVPGIYPVSLIVINAWGSDTIKFNNYITANPQPVVSVTRDTAICTGSGIQLSCSGGTIYSWSPSTGLSNANISNPIATPTIGTKYTVNVTDNNGCSSVGSVNIKVNPLPVLHLSPDTSLCSGSSTQLSASGGIDYAWIPSAGLSDTAIANPIANPVSTTSYIVDVMDSNGCKATGAIDMQVNPLPLVVISSDTSFCVGSSAPLFASGGVNYAWMPSGGLSDTAIANPLASPTASTIYFVAVTDGKGCIAIDSVAIQINPPPIVYTSADTALCLGASAQLFASGGVDYAWSPSAGLSDSAIANPVVNPSVTANYIVVVKNSKGCTAIDSVAIQVNSLPIVYTSSDTTLCMGVSAQLSASGGVNYAWSPSTGLSDSAIANPVANPSVTTNYLVAVTDANGCSAAGNITITVNSLPVVRINADTSLCPGSSTQLIASGGADYEWTPSVWLSDTTISNPIATPDSSIAYSVRVTGVDGCQAGKTINITVNQSPPAPQLFQSVSMDTLYCSTDSAYISYQWYLDSTVIIGATDTFYVVTHDGNYNVVVADRNGCMVSTGINIVLLNSTGYYNFNFLSLTPNPATDQLTIHSSYPIGEAVTVSVVNMLGQNAAFEVRLQSGWESSTIDISNLAAGIYFLRLKSEDGSVMKKFLKE